MSSSGTLDILDDTPPAAFKIGWANMHYGGLRYLETGGLGMKPVDDTDWRETIATLAPMEPDILALQEMHAGDISWG